MVVVLQELHSECEETDYDSDDAASSCSSFSTTSSFNGSTSSLSLTAQRAVRGGDVRASNISEGAPAFQPPEVACGHCHLSHSPQVDIWAAGITLYYMVVGKYPFEGTTVLSLFESITKGTYTIPDFVSAPLADLIRHILNPNREERFTIEQIRKHEYVLVNTCLSTALSLTHDISLTHSLTHDISLTHSLTHSRYLTHIRRRRLADGFANRSFPTSPSGPSSRFRRPSRALPLHRRPARLTRASKATRTMTTKHALAWVDARSELHSIRVVASAERRLLLARVRPP